MWARWGNVLCGPYTHLLQQLHESRAFQIKKREWLQIIGWKDLQLAVQGWTNINILTLPTKPFAEAL